MPCLLSRQGSQSTVNRKRFLRFIVLLLKSGARYGKYLISVYSSKEVNPAEYAGQKNPGFINPGFFVEKYFYITKIGLRPP